ncbi:hypothetical protein YC2023_029484 [Brassica napus]
MKEANSLDFHDDHHRKVEPVMKQIPIVVLVAELTGAVTAELVTLDYEGFSPPEVNDLLNDLRSSPQPYPTTETFSRHDPLL